MEKILYQKSGRVAQITLNRPKVLNAIDSEMPALLESAVEQANDDADVRVIVLSGAGRAFCAGYDMGIYAEGPSDPATSGDGVWNVEQDFDFMWKNTQHFMSLWRSPKPVIAKIHGYAVAGGSDIALCCDLVVMANDAEIGYMPARVWGCPTTAMWVYRLGAERAKRMLLTGDKIDGQEAARIGLVMKSVPASDLDGEVDALARRISTVPISQLAMQKAVINQAVEAMGLLETQKLATASDGVARHSVEGGNFKNRAESVGWKQAVSERDSGGFDWTRNRPFDPTD